MDASADLHNLNVTLSVTGAAVFCDLARPIGSAISPAPDCRSAAMSSGEQIAQLGIDARGRERGRKSGRSWSATRAAQHAGAIQVPKATLAQMMAANEIAKGGKCGCRDAGVRRFLGGTSGGLRQRRGGEGVIDVVSLLRALGKLELGGRATRLGRERTGVSIPRRR